MYHAPHPYAPSWHNTHAVTCTTLRTLHAAPPSSFFGHHMTRKPFIHTNAGHLHPLAHAKFTCPRAIPLPMCNPHAHMQPSCPRATLMPTRNPHAHAQPPCPRATSTHTSAPTHNTYSYPHALTQCPCLPPHPHTSLPHMHPPSHYPTPGIPCIH